MGRTCIHTHTRLAYPKRPGKRNGLKQADPGEIQQWMTPPEGPRATRTSEFNELLDPYKGDLADRCATLTK